MKKINQVQPWIDNKEANYIKKVVLKTYLTENKETEKFEKNIKRKFKAKNVISVSNWTAGIFMCLKLMKLKPEDEVIIPNVTFIATATPLVWLGVKIVLCDINKDNLSIDLKKLKKLITNKTKCIIPVHLYGYCCDLDELHKIIKGKGIFILEDAAQAIGATYKNKYLGTFSDFGGFSFYGNKIITTGEGGIIIFKNKKYNKKLYSLKNHGRYKKGIFKHQEIGYNFMFTEMQAAIGNIQLKKLNLILAKKKQIHDNYYNNLKNIKDIRFMKPIKGNEPVHWFTNIITKKKSKLQNFLKKHKIQTRDMFLPLNDQPCFKKIKLFKNLNKKFNVSKELYNQFLSLPSSYNLKTSEQKFIIDKIKLFFK